MLNINDVKIGMSIKYDGNVYTVLETQHVKPGKGAAFVKAKVRNIKTGSIIEETFNSSAKVEQAILNKKKMSYLYHEGDDYYFMDLDDYSQISVKKDILGKNVNYLKENSEVLMEFYESDIIGINVGDKITLKITHTEPAVKGNTSSGAQKDATLETGYVIKVPIFLNEGDSVIISTSDGKYVSRS